MQITQHQNPQIIAANPPAKIAIGIKFSAAPKTLLLAPLLFVACAAEDVAVEDCETVVAAEAELEAEVEAEAEADADEVAVVFADANVEDEAFDALEAGATEPVAEESLRT